MKLGVFRVAVTVMLASVLHACGASPGSGVTGAAHAVTLAASPHAKVNATLHISVPSRSRASATSIRKAAYVSPATQSIAVQFSPTSGGQSESFNQNLTPGSAGCTASLVSPLICTVTFSLAPGSYIAAFSTYDGQLDPSNNPTGALLSQNQNAPITIVAGQSNTINATLEGNPVALALIPSVASQLTGSQSAGFGLSKCFASETISVIGIDADNNFIVGPGAPTPKLASSDTTQLAVAVASPSSPNSFTISRPGIPNAHTSITLTATVTPGTGGGSPVSAPIGILFDGTICGVFSGYDLPTPGSDPNSISVGIDGALWFTELNTYKIGRITTAGTLVEYDHPSGRPSGIALGKDGAEWFIEVNSSGIGRITSAGVVTEFSGATIGSQSYDIVSGPDDALWFTEPGTHSIGRITTAGDVTEYAISVSGGPWWIAAGPDGAIWFTASPNIIGRVTTTGAISGFYTPTPNSSPSGIATGQDGALWFTENNGNKIGRISTAGNIVEYAIPTVDTRPFDIVNGPDGALWFTEPGAGKIGRITLNGSIAEYSLPNSDSSPYHITLGPDGALWFTETLGNKIGRLQ